MVKGGILCRSCRRLCAIKAERVHECDGQGLLLRMYLACIQTDYVTCTYIDIFYIDYNESNPEVSEQWQDTVNITPSPCNIETPRPSKPGQHESEKRLLTAALQANGRKNS